MSALIVIAKEPVPGRVKTRLVPPLSYDDAADLAAAALRDTLDAVDGHPATDKLLAFADDVRGWLPTGWRSVAQPAGGLDRRLAAAFAAATPGPTVLVGMDTPQLRADQLTIFDPYRFDACLGLAHDGGFWAVGFADPSRAAAAIMGVPMSRPDTGAQQLGRMRRLCLRVQLLDELTDVDDISTAEEVAELAPSSSFARRLAALQVRA